MNPVSPTRQRQLAIAAVLAVTALAFLPALKAGYLVNWDDPEYLFSNPLVTNGGFWNLFTSLHRGLYKPLTLATFWLEYHLFGFHAWLSHGINLALHLFNTALVFKLAETLLRPTTAESKTPRWTVPLITALAFGIHPMHSESVAWVAERKDVLYSFFFLLSMLFYLSYRENGSRKSYAASCGALLFSLMVKPMGITMPVLLLLVDYLQHRRFDRPAWTDKLPYFILAAGFALAGLFTTSSNGMIYAFPNYTPLDNFLVGCMGLLNYTWRFFLPAGLSTLYPLPDKAGGAGMPFYFYLAPVILATVFGALFYFLRKNKTAVFGMAFFLAAVLPGVQFIPSSPTIGFDHYTYISYIGPMLACAVFAAAMLDRGGRAAKTTLALLCAFLGFFFAGTLRRSMVWHDSVTLWTDVLEKYPGNSHALINRAEAAIQMGLAGAQVREDLELAIKKDPKNSFAYFNRGVMRFRENNLAGAERDFAEAVRLDKGNAPAFIGRGSISAMKGDFSSALTDFDRAQALNPLLTDALVNAGSVYLAMGEIATAVKRFEKALSINRDLDKALALLAQARLALGDEAGAAAAAERALKLNHISPQALLVRGEMALSSGSFRQALSDFDKVISLEGPTFLPCAGAAQAAAATGDCASAERYLAKARRAAPREVDISILDKAVGTCKQKTTDYSAFTHTAR